MGERDEGMTGEREERRKRRRERMRVLPMIIKMKQTRLYQFPQRPSLELPSIASLC